jgi:hypothetical protein
MRRAGWGDGCLKFGPDLLHCNTGIRSNQASFTPNRRAALPPRMATPRLSVRVVVAKKDSRRGPALQEISAGGISMIQTAFPLHRSIEPPACSFFISCTLPRWWGESNLSCKDYGRLK